MQHPATAAASPPTPRLLTEKLLGAIEQLQKTQQSAHQPELLAELAAHASALGRYHAAPPAQQLLWLLRQYAGGISARQRQQVRTALLGLAALLYMIAKWTEHRQTPPWVLGLLLLAAALGALPGVLDRLFPPPTDPAA